MKTNKVPLKIPIKILQEMQTTIYFVMFGGNNFLGQTVSFGICRRVVFSHDKIHCPDPSKQPRALANFRSLHKFKMLSYGFASAQHLGFSTLLRSVKNSAKSPWSSFRVLTTIDSKFSGTLSIKGAECLCSWGRHCRVTNFNSPIFFK